MPVIPQKGSEMEAELAKGKQSEVDSKPQNGGNDGKKTASLEHHQANPGPVMTDNKLGEPATKEELQRREEELNRNN